MPIQKAAYKSLRKDKRRHQRNLRVSSELKTLIKKFEALVNANKPKEAKEALRLLVSRIDKAASKGIIHKNTASRKKSRLTKRLKKSESSQ